MPSPELQFYTNLVVPGITENGHDVVNRQEFDEIVASKQLVTQTDLSTATIGKATNIANGTANQIPYQSAANTTSFVTAPTTSDTYLKWSGSAFVWSSSTASGVTSVAGRTGDVTLSTSDISGYGSFSSITVTNEASASIYNTTYGSIISGTLQTTTTNSNQVLLSVSSTTYRTIDYFIQIVSGSSYESTRVTLLHNGSTVTYNEYNTLVTDSVLAIFDADISGGNIRLLTTPSNASTTYKIVATAIYA